MNFTIPTTKDEMYLVLKDLFNYYRIKKDPFEEVLLEPLKLQRIEYQRPTDNEISLRAGKLVEVDNAKEIAEKKMQLNQEIVSCQENLSVIDQNFESEKTEIENLYEKTYEKLRQTAIKNGLINTSAFLDKVAKLESEKSEKISALLHEKNQQKADINAKIASFNDTLNRIYDIYGELQTARVLAKVEQLKSECDAIDREVFIYNNGLDEKEQKHESTLIRANANLKLKYMEITMGEYSKDELVDMGYYDHVVECITAYYDRLEPLVAYNEIKRDSQLVVYADDYYQNLIIMYGARAGVFE